MPIRLVSPSLALLLAAVAVAQQNENDVLICALEADPNQLVTGEVDVIVGTISVPEQVYREAATQITGIDDLRGDEGFFSVSDPALLPAGYVPPPGNVNIGFDFHAFTIAGETHNLWFWDPLADPDVDFTAPPTGVTLSFTKTPVAFFTATVDGSAVDVPGFTIDLTSPGGALHKHLNIVIDDADSDLATAVPPGIYAVAYTLWHPNGSSELVFLVINGGMGPGGDCATTRAYEFFQEYLDGVPCTGDIDGDNDVDLADFAVLQSNFGVANGANREAGDLDGDCDVDLNDVAVLVANLGSC